MDTVASEFVARSANWLADLETLFERIGDRFERGEMWGRACEYVWGLLGPVGRKNGWQLSEAVRRSTPYSIQHLLDRAHWDVDGVRDTTRDYAVAHLGQRDAVLVVDETGFLKKGTHSAGVQRQYSGTAGRIENCQIGVFLAYASARGHTLVDRELYLPQQWADDGPRRAAAKVPAEVTFATKPQLAQRMIARAVAAKVPFAWITGDEVYGDNRSLCFWLEQQGLHYVMAVASNQPVAPHEQWCRLPAREALERCGADDWVKLPAGMGSKGPRWYDWLRIRLLTWREQDAHWLLVRRSRSDPAALAYYICHAPCGTDLATLVRVAGMRWAVEECFEAAKGEVGLDQYEVRSWHGWYRHITLAMLAHAFLAALCAKEIGRPRFKKKNRASSMQQWKRQHVSSLH